MEGFEWIIGAGVAFGFAFAFTYLMEQDLPVFIAFLTMFIGFVVWAGLLPMWTLIMCIIVLVAMIYMKAMEKKSGGG